MLKTRIAKIAGLTLGVTFALGLSVNTAGAQTIAELQAQINALMAQLAALQGGAAVSTTFTTDLTVGSTGSQVVALQSMLVAQGHLVMPAGVAMGYFGPLTRAAVMRWQAANGVSATGYFGPISRAKANASGGATGVVPGATVGSGTSVGGTINTPGVEGSLTVTETAVGTTDELSEGDDKVSVLGLELEAVTSDIRVERVELNLGTDEDIYRDIVDRVYVMDGSTVLASKELNSSTVIENSAGTLVVTITGMNFIVRAGAEENITIAFDALSTIDDADEGGAEDVWTVTVPIDGVRGVDGAGINQFGPDSAIAETFSVEGITAGELVVSEASSNPDATSIEIDADNTTEDVVMLVFELEADEQDVTVDDIVVALTVSAGGTTETFSSVSLYRGSTLLESETAATSTTFSNLDLVIEAGDTETFTIKADINDVGAGFASGQTASVSVAGSTIVAEDEEGDDVTTTGTATGETMTFVTSGVSVAAVSTDADESAFGTSGSEQGDFTIVFNVTSFEDDQYIYKGASVASSTTAGLKYTIYQDGTASTTLESAGFATDVVEAAGSTTGDTSDYFLVEEGETRQFTLRVNLNPTTTGWYKVELNTVRHDATEDDSAADDTHLTVPDTDSFETDQINVNG